MTQEEITLARLQRGPTCGTELLRMHIPRYSARIYTLRKEGHDIGKRRCENPTHNHTKSIQYEFFLVNKYSPTLFPLVKYFIKL